VGQKGTRYTVNDGSVNNWTLQLASRYGKTITPVASGGLSYAAGNARITAKPDAAGDATTLTVTEQIDRFLASGTFGANDVVLINGGISDLIAGMAAVRAGTTTPADMVAAARKAGQELATQVRRLVNAGAKHVVVTGTYDLSKTPWATAISQTSLLNDASSRFNEGLLVNIVDLGANVLYMDAAYYVNLYTSSPGSYSFDNATTAGVHLGGRRQRHWHRRRPGQLGLCTTATLLPSANQNKYVFADAVYLTPSAHRQLGDYAYDRLRARW
jgi:outer membrane lipase/esterase